MSNPTPDDPTIMARYVDDRITLRALGALENAPYDRDEAQLRIYLNEVLLNDLAAINIKVPEADRLAGPVVEDVLKKNREAQAEGKSLREVVLTERGLNMDRPDDDVYFNSPRYREGNA